jgi:hypothetical protein
MECEKLCEVLATKRRCAWGGLKQANTLILCLGRRFLPNAFTPQRASHVIWPVNIEMRRRKKNRPAEDSALVHITIANEGNEGGSIYHSYPVIFFGRHINYEMER